VLIALGCAAAACQLRRPDVPPVRMIEPQLPEAKDAVDPPAGLLRIRLLDTQSRAHIGRRLLHQQADGELVEDVVWRWSSAPDRYLESALRLSASNAGVQLVDAGNAPTIAVTLIAWHIESSEGRRMVGAVEVQFVGGDRSVQTEVIRGSEPVSAELPGDLAVVSGRLITSLALQSLGHAVRNAKQTTRVGDNPSSGPA